MSLSSGSLSVCSRWGWKKTLNMVSWISIRWRRWWIFDGMSILAISNWVWWHFWWQLVDDWPTVLKKVIVLEISNLPSIPDNIKILIESIPDPIKIKIIIGSWWGGINATNYQLSYWLNQLSVWWNQLQNCLSEPSEIHFAAALVANDTLPGGSCSQL